MPGEQTRAVKALSPDEIEGYLNGHGMGMALAAELNHYPGPIHVLEMAEPLELTADQAVQTRHVYDQMHEHAVELGTKIVEAEKELDRAFADRSITNEELARRITEIGTLRARLRATHLEAHLRMKQILSLPQIHEYDRLRGYGSGMLHDHQHHHHEGG